MWQARGRGKHAVLEGDKLKINEVLFDLEFCEKNFTNGAENSSIRSRAGSLQGLNFQSERKRKDKDTHQEEEKLEELAVEDSITKPMEQRGKTCNMVAQLQVGQRKDNLESKEGANKGNDELLNTIIRGRREGKLDSNWSLQSRQSGCDRLQHNGNEGNRSKHVLRNENKGLTRYCERIGREQPKNFNWIRQRYGRDKVISSEVSIAEKNKETRHFNKEVSETGTFQNIYDSARSKRDRAMSAKRYNYGGE